MSKHGSELCPVCRCGMFPGDVVCLRCQSRVRAVMPHLLSDYANRDISAPENLTAKDALRAQITLCAIQQLPAFGRPPRGPQP